MAVLRNIFLPKFKNLFFSKNQALNALGLWQPLKEKYSCTYNFKVSGEK